MIASAVPGLKASFESKHETGDGRLISIDKTRKFEFLGRYDSWRVAYCEKYRNKNLPVSLRAGKINPFTLLVSIILIIQEVGNATRAKSM